MTIDKTEFDGLLLINLDVFTDERGSFREAWHTAKLTELGLPQFKPVQHNVAYSKKGVVRGIHAEPWDKYAHPTYGLIFACIVDLRPQSQTFGQHITFELDETQALFVPKGFGNAYQTLSEFAVYSYLVTDHWSADVTYPSIIYNDQDLNIKWPISPVIVSDKDKNNSTFRQAYPSYKAR